MARRRRRQNSLDYIRLPQVEIDPEMKKGIFIIIILAFGAISLLSLFGLAEGLGRYLEKGIIFLFGWDKWIFPIFWLVLGFLMYNREKEWVRGANYLGLFIFVIFFNALLHSFVGQENWQSAVAEGVGGGYIGYSLLTFFNQVMGFWASLIAIVCLIFIALMLMFNASLESIIGRDSWFAKILQPINYLYNKIFNRREESEKEIEEPDLADSEDEEEEETEDESDEEKISDVGFYQHKIKNEKEKISSKKTETEIVDSGWKPTNIKIELPLNLLNDKIGRPTSGDIKNNMLIIQRTLESFGIPVEMGEYNVGPTVTQYTLKPADGVRLSKITALNNDLALNLAAHPIRIEAPIPGRSLVGVEVPNQTKAIVGLREVLTSEMYRTKKSNTMIALGKDVSGKVWLDDLVKMPHLLVAGATNSGKSVCLNAIVVSLLYQNSPDDLRLIMVDPKRVELTRYNKIPHLLTPVIIEAGKAFNALKWCLNEMDRRYDLLSQLGYVDISSYNSSQAQKIPYLVFIVDELAELMMVAGRELEPAIIRLIQMGRAVGIHLILATQRPSVNVITGLIKANMPARIAFAVASGIDSRTILDTLGAEKLLGRGDMLFTNSETSKPRRLQGAFLSENEIKRIVNFIKEQSGEPQYVEGVTDKQKTKLINGASLDGDGEGDDLLLEAKEIIINSGKASASYLQRRLSVGYARAARLLDLLEQEGVVGPGQGAKPREILISKEQYDSMISQGISGLPLHKREETQAPDQFLPQDEAGQADENEEAETSEAEPDDATADEAEDEAEPIGPLPKAAEKEAEEQEENQQAEKRKKTVSLPDEDEPLFDLDDEDDGKYFSR